MFLKELAFFEDFYTITENYLEQLKGPFCSVS